MRALLPFLAILATLPLSAATFDELVSETMKQWRIPGAAVVVVQNDRVVHLRGYGRRELRGGPEVTPDTSFQLGSTSKAFTTAAIAMLVDAKLIAWDDRVHDHVPAFHTNDPCAVITIRDLLSHRTGIARHDELWDNTPLSRDEIVHAIEYLPFDRQLRSGYGYNNIMYIVAGEAVRSASGMSWDDFVQRRLFAPLGMTHTTASDEVWGKSERANGYRWDAKTESVKPFPMAGVPTLSAAGAIKSTARDMGQWLRFQLANGAIGDRRLVSEEALAETKKPASLIALDIENHPLTTFTAYGLGWRLQDYRGGPLVWHVGALNGFRALVVLLPKRNAGFAVLINLGRGDSLSALRNAIADQLIGGETRDWNAHYLALEKKERDAAEARLAARYEQLRAGGVRPPRNLTDYEAVFLSPSHGRATVIAHDDALVLKWARQSLRLTHLTGDLFRAIDEVEGLDELVEFEFGPDGRISGMKYWGMPFAIELYSDRNVLAGSMAAARLAGTSAAASAKATMTSGTLP